MALFDRGDLNRMVKKKMKIKRIVAMEGREITINLLLGILSNTCSAQQRNDC